MDEARAWAEEQWSTCRLGDRRRTARAVAMGAAMADRSGASLPGQMAGLGDLKAAYRPLDADGVTLDALTAPHRARARRAAAWVGGPVPFVQDGTRLDFTAHRATGGLGPIGNGSETRDAPRGPVAQTCLAAVPGPAGRRVLGLAAPAAAARGGFRPAAETPARRRRRDDESGLRLAPLEAVGPPPAGATWVGVGDRGSDVSRYFRRAVDAGRHVLSRLRQDRLVEGLAEPGEAGSLPFRLRDLPAMAEATVERPAAGAPRRVALSIAGAAVRMRPPRRGPRRRPAPLDCWPVRARGEGLEWLPLSSVPVPDAEAAARATGWYACRWLVEECHKALETGCRYERAQPRAARRLPALLGFLALVAVRLPALRDAARARPIAPATEVVPVLPVRLVAHRFGLDPDAMTARAFWRAVARAGGFLGRKGDGDPGWETLRRGWTEVLQWCRGALSMQALARSG